jgi:hypothetical protein
MLQSGVCAWQKAGEISNKSAAAWPWNYPPQFTQELAHGSDPFVGWLRAGSEKRLGGNSTLIW